MRYSFNTWCYSSFPTWLPSYPLEVTAERLAAIGYDAIEIGCAAPHAWPAYLSAEKRTRLKQHIEGLGMKVSGVLPAPGGGPGCNVASCLPEEREWAIKHYMEVCDLGSDLGAELLIYVGGWRNFGTSEAQARDWSAAALAQIAARALERGMRVAVEPTPADSNLVETADDAIDLMERVGLENVGVMTDTFHVLYRNEVMSDAIYRMGKNLIHTHLSDHGRLAPGDGGSDFSPVAHALKAIGYEGYVGMEIAFNRRDIDPDVYASRALKYMRGLFGE